MLVDVSQNLDGYTLLLSKDVGDDDGPGLQKCFFCRSFALLDSPTTSN